MEYEADVRVQIFCAKQKAIITINHYTKMNRILRLRCFPWLVTTILMVVPSSFSKADVTIAEYNGSGDFSFNVNFMTDLDQLRSGLGLGGSMFCVPTACMNLLTYAANFGFPDVFPGPGLWEGTDRHAEMTGYIFSLANGMGTDWEDGTSLADAHDELADDVASDGLVVASFGAEGDYWPLVDSCAFSAANGAVVNFCYGRWEALTTPGAPGAAYILKKRLGGHCVTLQRATAETGTSEGHREIQFRDPVSSDSVTSNSDFASKDVPTAANIGVGYDYDDDSFAEPFIVTSMNDTLPDDGIFRLLDSYIALFPPAALSFSHVKVGIHFPGGGLGFSTSSPAGPFAPPPGGAILDVVTHPELHSSLILVAYEQGGKSLVQAPHGQDRVIQLMDLPSSVQRLALGYGHTVTALTETDFIRLRVHSGSATRVETVPIPHPGRGVIPAIIDTANVQDSIYVLRRDASVQVFDADTLELQFEFSFRNPYPRAVPSAFAIGGKKERFMLVVMNNGIVLEAKRLPFKEEAVVRDNKSLILPTRVLRLRGVSEAMDVDVDDGGRLYVSDARKGLLEFTLDRRNSWHPVLRPRYVASDFIGQRVAILKSHTNYRQEIHGEPGWRTNIHPDDLLPLGPEIKD